MNGIFIMKNGMFCLKCCIFYSLPTQNLYDHLDEIEKLGYSVHVFTTFADKAVWNALWFIN